MPSIGDLANDIARSLYEFRIPVAVASIVGAVLLVIVAWRLGWFASARRHPGRSGIVLAMALVVGAPLTWYLASPIFIRTALIEPAPVVAAPVVAAAPTPTPSPTPPATEAPTTGPDATPGPTPISTPPPTPEPTTFQATTLASGSFTGTDDFHFGNGTASIIETSPGRYHIRLEDFSVRNGPDLFVYLSPSADGYAKGALEVGKLKATDGSFGYDLPAGTDPSTFRSAIIWCKQFSHLFAVAPFAG